MNAECGTYGGYMRHQNAKEPPCDPCRRARNAWLREYRKRPDVALTRRTAVRARDRAMQRLKQEHPERFAQLLAEEKLLAIQEVVQAEKEAEG